MATYLDKILARHREVAALDDRPLDDLIERARAMPPARGFAQQLVATEADDIRTLFQARRRAT